jgi:hypothetical protein
VRTIMWVECELDMVRTRYIFGRRRFIIKGKARAKENIYRWVSVK